MYATLPAHLTSTIESMPAFPRSVQRILTLSRDLDASPRELVEVIDKDPVVTVRILKVINSAYYGLPRQITSVAHAVAFLGFNTIKNMALGIAAAGMLPARDTGGLAMQPYLVHSLATAGLARLLAQRCADADPSDAYIAGLLHDFGKVVLALAQPHELSQALAQAHDAGASLHEVLRDQIGVDHAQVGAALALHWRFAPALVHAMASHDAVTPQIDDLSLSVFAANQLAKKLSFGDGGNPCVRDWPEWAAQRLGGTLDALAAEPARWQPVFEEAQLFASA